MEKKYRLGLEEVRELLEEGQDRVMVIETIDGILAVDPLDRGERPLLGLA